MGDLQYPEAAICNSNAYSQSLKKGHLGPKALLFSSKQESPNSDEQVSFLASFGILNDLSPTKKEIAMMHWTGSWADKIREEGREARRKARSCF